MKDMLLKTWCSFLILTLALYSFGRAGEDTISVKTPMGILHGSLFVPEQKLPCPAVILLPGSGPTDKYGNSAMGFSPNTYKMMAESFLARGIATLLIDKRGIGTSMAAFKSEETLRFDDYVEDALLWTESIKNDKRFSGVYVVGHSEGSLIGMLVCERTKVQGYISIAGPAKSADAIIVDQYRAADSSLGRQAEQLFKQLLQGTITDSIPQILMSIFRPSIQPYIRNWAGYKPCAELKKLSVPILIIQGTNDLQVPPGEAYALKNCAPKARLLVVPGMNHVLKPSPAERQANFETYSNSTLALSPQLISGIAGFIKKR